MDLTTFTFVCLECGYTEKTKTVGWKHWCPHHEMTFVWTNDGIEKRRRVVEMTLIESVNA